MIAPTQSVDTKEAVAKAKKKRKRVQTIEEVLTTPSALQRLRDEAESTVAKKLTKNYSSQNQGDSILGRKIYPKGFIR